MVKERIGIAANITFALNFCYQFSSILGLAVQGEGKMILTGFSQTVDFLADFPTFHENFF